MEYADRIQLALDYIEAHLETPLSLAEIAAQAAFSSWHFQRLFSSLTGDSLKAYVRKRRLTAAALDLQASEQRILNIALKYRFESQAAFTRAFKAWFGCTPGQYRRQKRPPALNRLLRITPEYLNYLTGGLQMEPELMDLETLQVVGLRQRFISILGAEPNNFEVIPALWDRFKARRDEIQGVRADLELGLCLCEESELEDANPDEMSYLAGAVLEQPLAAGSLPPEMELISIPAGRYARFTHLGFLDKLPHTMRYIHHAWLPRSGYELDQRLEIEWYDSRFRPDAEDSAFDILIPLAKS